MQLPSCIRGYRYAHKNDTHIKELLPADAGFN